MAEVMCDDSSTLRSSPAAVYDHHDPTCGNEPARFAEISGGSAVFWTQCHGGYWVVTSDELCRTVLSNWRTFSSAHHYDDIEGIRYGGIAIPEAPVIAGLVEDDPPQWDILRRACAPFLSRHAVEALRSRVSAIAQICLERRIESGAIEFVADIAGPVPTIITMSAVGVPLRAWPRYMTTQHALAHLPPSDPGYNDMLVAVGELIDELYQLVDERRTALGDDLVSRLLTLRRDGRPLVDEEIVNTVLTVIAGGIDTTTSLISHALQYLSGDPAARASLNREPGMIAFTREEMLRHGSPAQHTARTVTRDVQLGNQQLRRGDRLLVSLAAANRDGKQHAFPARVDFDRKPQHHIAFGFGIHRCLGAELARMEFDVVVDAVLARIPDFQIDAAAAKRYAHNPTTVNGWVCLPAVFEARPKNDLPMTIPGLTAAQTAELLSGFDGMGVT